MTPESYQTLNDEFFAPFAHELRQFATLHNLTLEVYPREWPCWKFCFRHPKGGIGSIDVMREENNSLKLYSSWWVDDVEQYARFIYGADSGEFDISIENLVISLEAELSKILSWQQDQLKKVDFNYEPYWKPWKAILKDDTKRYSYPNP